MKYLPCFAFLLSALLLAGCAIQSDTVLPEAVKMEDAIEGFPTDAPFRLETFQPDESAYKTIGTITPVSDDSGIRYSLAFEEDKGSPNRMVLQARKMTDGNYLLRYTQVVADRQPSLDESGLAFISVRDGTYFVLSSIAREETLREIFPGQALPPGAGTSTLTLETMDQAIRISAWFAQHYNRLGDVRNNSRFRVGR